VVLVKQRDNFTFTYVGTVGLMTKFGRLVNSPQESE